MILVSIIGRKGAGTSEMIEWLIVFFNQMGRRIGVAKRLGRDDIEIDQPGKDTYRYRAGGAETVVLAGRKQMAVFSNRNAEAPLEDILRHFEGFDVVILEGYFNEGIPKIEVFRIGLGEPPLALRIPDVAAVCSDEPSGVDLPHFSRGSLEDLAAFILARCAAERIET